MLSVISQLQDFVEKNKKDLGDTTSDSSNIANEHFEYGNQVHFCNANRVDVNNAILLEESTNSVEDDLGNYTSLTNLTDKNIKEKGESVKYTHQLNEISEIAPSKLPEEISSDAVVVCPEDKFSVRDLPTADITILDHAIVGEHQQTYAEVVKSHPATNKICPKTEKPNMYKNPGNIQQ